MDSTTGDDGFDEFVRETSGRLLAAAYLLTGSREQAEDLTQEAYARVFLRWSRLKDEAPYAYARTIMLNRHRDWWRRPFREVPTVHEPTPRDTHDDSSLLGMRDQLMRAMRSLTPRERSVVILKYFEDASEDDIAQALHMARGTVKSTTNRALRKMRDSEQFTARGDLHDW